MTESEYLRPTILVVDDTPSHLRLLCNLLKEQYRVNAVTSGAKAVELAISSPPDLVLLDIMMPDFDGYEVCRRLKANDSTRLVPVIFLTAKLEIEDEELGFSVGAVDYIHKPISPPLVLARVKTHLEIKSGHDFLKKQTEMLTIARDSLDRTNNELTAEIAKRIDVENALKESMRRVEEKELAKSRFLAAAGHDLRQPLAAASLFIDALRFTNVSAEQNQIIQRLDHAISIFNGLLDALLNISKLDAGVIKPEYAVIDVVEIFNLLEQNFAPVAMEKKLAFKLCFPIRERLFIRSDIGLLNSILMNLVSNAINYTSQGTVLIAARRRGSCVLFQVWDTGMGIEEDHFGHIFDEFYQINNPQRDRTKGMGLGLAIAKRALALLGREISCHSRVGRGSVFEFSLPMASSPDTAVQPVAADLPEDAINLKQFVQGRKFMVVEDDALVSEAMCKALRMMGGTVELFHSAETALSHVTIEHADYFFIADYMLEGGLYGIEFLNQLRQKIGKPINALLVTGDTSPAFVREAVECDWPVLHKPVNISKLIAHIKLTCP